MFQLATLLFQRGFSVTVIHTLFNAPDPSGHPHFRFVAIDDGLPKEVLNCHDILAKAIAITKACRVPFRDCLVRLLEQDRSCMAWLDRHPAGSVIYVSFGSLADMEKEELAEVVWGLAGSGQPFLWVVRLGSVRGEAGVELPAGFVDETQGRGMVVAWAPQVEVLAHPAVGAFWTHYGWNSIVESLCEGVPCCAGPTSGTRRGTPDEMAGDNSGAWEQGSTTSSCLERVEQILANVQQVLLRLEHERQAPLEHREPTTQAADIHPNQAPPTVTVSRTDDQHPLLFF
ncbi:hypothetical protein Taro_001519 [Colocasia esculenta]|uniref:Uncharacterized protein n=1 Tax=Colocasia esculenta TaxID=4460 RepID=A0A843TIB4_COLES|nr:hypothetical protein [Colocasia esculenta]